VTRPHRAGRIPAGTRSATLGLALVLLLLGCSSSQTATRATPRPTASAAPSGGLDAGWILHADNAGGFAVAFPDAWVQAMSDSPTLTDDLAAIAAQQADAAAQAIAALAGAPVEPELFHPVIHGMLLTGALPRYLSAGFTGRRRFNSEVTVQPKWSSPDKISAKYLAPYLDDTFGSGPGRPGRIT